MTLSLNMVERNGKMYLPYDLPNLKDRGINKHSWLTAFFVRLFGSGIIEQQNKDGDSFYYNRKSLVTWITDIQSKINPALVATPNITTKSSDEEIRQQFHNLTHFFFVHQSRAKALAERKAEEERIAALSPEKREAEEKAHKEAAEKADLEARKALEKVFGTGPVPGFVD